MKLELKHLAPYLPFCLKGIDLTHPELIQMINGLLPMSILTETDELSYGLFKPILRPLSDLNSYKYKPRYGNKITISQILTIENKENLLLKNIDEIPYAVVEILLKYHFDIFGLIENNLAIDINNL